MKGQTRSDEVAEYLLSDYHFLEDYEIAQSGRYSNHCFVAKIKDTQQKVRFIKQKYTYADLERFKALHKLFKNGIILADNIFILEQCGKLFYYIIEAEIQTDNPRFQTLQAYLYDCQISFEEKKNMIGKIKILIDCVHQQGQSFAGLDSRKIIIDDEKHLYLTPFDLGLELKSDSMSRAYYSPELLQMMQNEQSEVTQEMMFKWDIWSFGCIAMQILKYCSPVFLSTSLTRQLKNIKLQAYKQQIADLEDSIGNILVNSLNPNPQYRTISIHKIDKNQVFPPMVTDDIKPLNPRQENNRKQRGQGKHELRELNLHKNQDSGDSELTLNIFTLSNVSFQKELHITIYLNRKYHFYIDFAEQDIKSYKLNRKITIRNNFNQFSRMLNVPILIQLKQDGKIARIKVNLQTLVIIYQGKRIWNKQLIGTYQSAEDSPFPKAKIKLSCLLNSPEVIEEEKMIYQANTQDPINTQIKMKVEKKPLVQIDKNYLTTREQKRQKSPSKQGGLLSIAQIAENIANITQNWRKKYEKSDQVVDETRQRLQNLLLID